MTKMKMMSFLKGLMMRVRMTRNLLKRIRRRNKLRKKSLWKMRRRSVKKFRRLSVKELSLTISKSNRDSKSSKLISIIDLRKSVSLKSKARFPSLNT